MISSLCNCWEHWAYRWANFWEAHSWPVASATQFFDDLTWLRKWWPAWLTCCVVLLWVVKLLRDFIFRLNRLCSTRSKYFVAHDHWTWWVRCDPLIIYYSFLLYLSLSLSPYFSFSFFGTIIFAFSLFFHLRTTKYFSFLFLSNSVISVAQHPLVSFFFFYLSLSLNSICLFVWWSTKSQYF